METDVLVGPWFQVAKQPLNSPHGAGSYCQVLSEGCQFLAAEVIISPAGFGGFSPVLMGLDHQLKVGRSGGIGVRFIVSRESPSTYGF